MRKFQWSIKKEVEFLGVIKWSRKNHVEFLWVLVFDLEISKLKRECTTIFQNFLVWSLFSLEFLKINWKTQKFQGFFKNILQLVLNDCSFWKCPESVSNYSTCFIVLYSCCFSKICFNLKNFAIRKIYFPCSYLSIASYS